MVLKSTPGDRTNRLVTTHVDMPLTFGLGALRKLAEFCQMYIQSGTTVGFTLGHDKKVKFTLSPTPPILKRKQGKMFLY